MKKEPGKSKWSTFLALLPTKFDEFPHFFNDKDLKLLEGSPIVMLIKGTGKIMKDTYNMICDKVPEFKKLATLGEFTKAILLVQSRSFG